MNKYDLVVIGAGPAGLAAAIEAYEKGINSILVVEREKEPGGILTQCIHTGFGLHTFKKDLTGPEYATYFIKKAKEYDIEIKLDTMVIDVNKDKVITFVNRSEGLNVIQAKSVILAMGCRERTRGALRMPGTRPAGIFTAGLAQKFVNIEGYMPGKEIVILGSGDIGLIMARRLTFIAGIFACGNVLHVHDLVDYVTEESTRAGRSAADYIKNKNVGMGRKIKVEFDKPIRYIMPQFLDYINDDVHFFFRVDNVCEKIKFSVVSEGNIIKSFTKTHLVPGEMQNIRIKKEELATIKGDKLKIEAK